MKKILLVLVILILISLIANYATGACGAKCSDYNNVVCTVGIPDDSDCSMEEWSGTGTACMVNPGDYSTGMIGAPATCSNCLTKECGCTDGWFGDALGSCTQDFSGGTRYCTDNRCPDVPDSKNYNGKPCTVGTSCDAAAHCYGMCDDAYNSCKAACPGCCPCGTLDAACWTCVGLCATAQAGCYALCAAECEPRGCELLRTEDTVWDQSEKKCIRCSGKYEDKNCGDTGGTHISITPSGYCTCCATGFTCDADRTCGTGSNSHISCMDVPNTCETACSGEVDSACDDVAEGGLCKAGELCESLGVGVTCSGTEKCVDCKCMLCGNGKVDPGEECDGDIDTIAEGATKDCEGLCASPDEPNPCKCKSATCGNGKVDPGEECDGNVDTIAEGATKDCEGRCVPPDKSPPCHCQICGNEEIEYPEECDPPNGVDCDGNCQIMGPPPTLPSGGCGGDYGCETGDITYTETKTLQHGNIQYYKKYSEVFPDKTCGWGAQLHIWLPWSSGEDDYKWPVILEGNSVTYTKSPDEYTVKLVDVHLGCDTITVEACCNAAPVGETDCHDGIDNNEPPNGKIDCEEGDAVCPEPDCGPCGTAVCDPGTYGDYEYHCELKPGAECAVPADCPPPGNPGDYECPLAGPDQCKCVPLIEVDCNNFDAFGNPIDDDGDGCFNGEDVDCGGTETDCFDVIDNNCDGETDCADPDCRFTAPDCNDCQNLTCNADGTWQWSCPTKAGAECSSNTECWATTKWCNLETCNCEEPPPTLASKWRIEDVACRIIVLLQEIVAGIATLIIVYAGIKWMGSGVTDPVARQEAADMIKAVFVGLVIIIVALQFINYMFGNELGTVSCPVNVTWHNMVIICDVPYMCDDTNSDGICPEDFGITCDVPDKDC